jgi:hypothetical protein
VFPDSACRTRWPSRFATWKGSCFSPRISSASREFTTRVGNLGRNTNTGRSFVTLDTRLSKFVQVQRVRIEAFVEAVNLTNKVNFGTPVEIYARRCLARRRVSRATAADRARIPAGFLIGL